MHVSMSSVYVVVVCMCLHRLLQDNGLCASVFSVNVRVELDFFLVCMYQ